ncbi:hypothetical protein D6G99_24625 [Salmonella enterica]|nr:hypothetical protein [Salmonella enterica]
MQISTILIFLIILSANSSWLSDSVHISFAVNSLISMMIETPIIFNHLILLMTQICGIFNRGK